MTMIAANLPHRLERTLLIQARRDTVFRFFTDPARWASWWGVGSTIDPRPDGHVVVRYPNGIEAHGHVIDIVSPERVIFTYGYASGTPIAAGASLVSIALSEDGANTRLHLTHAFSDAAVRDEHVQGWRYQLALFSNVVANEVCQHAVAHIDAWLGAWSDTDPERRAATLARIAAADVRFSDPVSTVESLDDLSIHLDAVHRFMPGIRLERDGVVRRCQSVALTDWVARAADGLERARGTNVFLFNSDGYMTSVTGLWNQKRESASQHERTAS